MHIFNIFVHQCWSIRIIIFSEYRNRNIRNNKQMVEYIDRYVFYMSYQNCYVLFSMRTTLSTWFKTDKSCTRSVNHHFRADVSAFAGSPYMMSRQTIQKSPDKSGERGSSGINAFSPTFVIRPGSDNSISLWCKLRHTIDISNFWSWFHCLDNCFVWLKFLIFCNLHTTF